MQNNEIKFLENVMEIHFGAVITDAEIREKITSFIRYAHYGGGVGESYF